MGYYNYGSKYSDYDKEDNTVGKVVIGVIALIVGSMIIESSQNDRMKNASKQAMYEYAEEHNSEAMYFSSFDMDKLDMSQIENYDPYSQYTECEVTYKDDVKEIISIKVYDFYRNLVAEYTAVVTNNGNNIQYIPIFNDIEPIFNESKQSINTNINVYSYKI